jgi:sec-independent protein translocase protein TatC
MQDMTPAKPLSGEPPKRPGQDDIDASKAPLMEHLIELRQRLIYSLLAFAGTFVACFFIAKPIYNILTWPFVRVVGQDKAKLIATHFLEQLFTNIKLAMFGAAFISFPFVAYQIYRFVAPGLYTNERDAFRPYLLWTWLLFLLGAAVVYFVVMPLLIQFSVEITPQEAGGGHAAIELLPKVSEYLSLIMTLVFGFGICFQLPVVLALLAQAGIVTAQNLKDFSRYAIVAIAAVSAVLSPPDPFSMLAMMAPTVALYYVSIWVVQQIEQKAASLPRLQPPDPADIYLSLCMPEVVGRLHVEPGPGGPTERRLKTHGHRWRHRLSFGQNFIQRLPGDAQFGRDFRLALCDGRQDVFA